MKKSKEKNKFYIPVIVLSLVIALVLIAIFVYRGNKADKNSHMSDNNTNATESGAESGLKEAQTGADGEIQKEATVGVDGETQEKNAEGDEGSTQEESTEPADIVAYGTSFPYNAEEVDFTGKDIVDIETLIEVLGKFDNLKKVDLYETGLSEADMHVLIENFPDMEYGWRIELAGVSVDSVDKEADISTHIVDNYDEFKQKLKLLPDLKYLDMCDCGLSNEQMEELRNTYPEIKFVWKVTLGLWTIRTDCVAFSTLKDGTITYRLTNEDTKVLKYCTDMVALDLGHNKVTDISFLQYMPELKILILVDNWAGEAAEHYIDDLSMLQYVPKLMYLEFFVGDVSDLSFLEYTPELVDLNISYNPISDVSYLLNLPKIERLFLEHTQLTEADYELLQKTYPDAQVVYYGEGSVDQGWRTHDRYFAMIDMYHNNYVHELFAD